VGVLGLGRAGAHVGVEGLVDEAADLVAELEVLGAEGDVHGR
jgi:hypothetical protein